MSESGHHSVYIPEDLVRQIFYSLPVKSLLRCKSVCKSWRSIITSANFVAKQLRYASCFEDNHRVMLKHCLKTSGRVHVSFLPDKKDAILSLVDAPVEPIAFFEGVDEQLGRITPMFFGPCNGIVCVAGYSDPGTSHRQCDPISLWNPATREMKRLPLSTNPPPPNLEYHELEGFHFGFGYDFKGHDYKVVKILHYYGPDIVRIIEVYSLSTDSWRIVPECMKQGWVSSEHLDGFHYWWEEPGPDDKRIVSFDYADEALSAITSPHVSNGGFALTTKYKDSLALLADDTDVSRYPLIEATALWVLNKDNGVDTWTKLFRLSKPYHDIVGMFRNGNVLINLDHWLYKLAVYDISSREVLTRNNFDEIYEPGFLQVVNYVESLVTFKRTDDEVSTSTSLASVTSFSANGNEDRC